MKHCSNDACPDSVRFERRGEYLDSVYQCASCGEILSPGPLPLESDACDTGPLEPVASYPEPLTAYIAGAKIEALGIPCWVQEHPLMERWLSSLALRGIRLWVPAEQAEAAWRILQRDDSRALANVPESSDAPTLAAWPAQHRRLPPAPSAPR